MAIFKKINFNRYGDKTPPLAVFVSSYTEYEKDDDSDIIVRGAETGAKIYVNGVDSGEVIANGTATVNVDTSGADGLKIFDIHARDAAGNRSIPAMVYITKDGTAPIMDGVEVTNSTHITVILNELATASTITKANAGGFTVEETGDSMTTYAVSAIAPGATNDTIVLTVADVSASASAGVTVKYTEGGNGTVADLAGNLLATDATGVATGAF